MTGFSKWRSQLGQVLVGLLLTAVVARVVWAVLEPLVPTLLGGALAVALVAYALRR